MTTLFVSDLHLAPERPGKLALFERLIERTAGRCDALYVLGDLFEYWVGDDDDGPPHPAVIAALAHFSAAGSPLYVMHGNRDFLLGERFARETGARLLPDPTVIELYGEPTLLMHGDTLCTNDHDYQALRRQVRDPEWQRRALARPLAERRALARQMRDGSRDAIAGKAESIMDVDEATVREAFRRHGVRRMIHGHTHRPAVHEMPLDGGYVRRIVLGDWYERDSVLVCRADRSERLLRVEDFLEGNPGTAG